LNIITILGSPRKHGNTGIVLNAFEKLISGKHTVEHITIPRLAVNGCLGCDACQRVKDKHGCIQKDGINAMLEKILCADMVVYACPVYVWDFPAQMKALMDRHYCFVKWKYTNKAYSLIQDKSMLLLATCGGDGDTNADLIQEIFKREMSYLQCHMCGCYIVPNCTTPAELGRTADRTAQQMTDDIMIKYTSGQ